MYIHLLKGNEADDFARVLLMSVTVLDGGLLRLKTLLDSHELCGEGRSLPVDSGLKTNVGSRLLLQEVEVERSSLYLENGRHLTTSNQAKASGRWTEEYYVALWSNNRDLRIAE